MTKSNPEGHVEFHSPPVKLVAEMPHDEEIREQQENQQKSNPYPGACPTISRLDEQNK